MEELTFTQILQTVVIIAAVASVVLLFILGTIYAVVIKKVFHGRLMDSFEQEATCSCYIKDSEPMDKEGVPFCTQCSKRII